MITLALSGGSLAYVFFLFLPGQLAVGSLRDQFREQQLFIVQSERLQSVIRSTEKELGETDAFCDAWREVAAVESKLPEFFGRITAAANKNGLDVVRLTPGAQIELSSIRRVPFALTTDGSFEQLFLFLRGVEAMPEVVWVTEMKISPDGGSTENVRCELELEVFTDNQDFSN